MYQLLGFPAPFLSVAACATLFSLSFPLVLPRDPEPREPASGVTGSGVPVTPSEESCSFRSVLREPGILVCLATGFVISLTLGYLNITMSLDLDSLHQSVTVISAVFLIHPTSHLTTVAVSSRFLARDESFASRFLLLGACVSTAGAILSGPIYRFPLGNSVSLIAIRQAMMGIASGALTQASLIALRVEAIASGLPDCLTLNSLLSSIFNATYAAA